jgi:hypothetical protein
VNNNAALSYLAHLSQSDRVSFCDSFLSVVRKLLLKMTSPHKPLGQFHPNFTGMFLWWSPLKIVQEFNSMQNSGCIQKKKLKISSFKKPKELQLKYLA